LRNPPWAKNVESHRTWPETSTKRSTFAGGPKSLDGRPSD